MPEKKFTYQELQDKVDSLLKKERYLEVINSFANTLLNLNTVEEIVWAVARHAIAKMEFVDCVVYLFDDNREYLIQRAAHGDKNPVDFSISNPIKLKVKQGIVGHIAYTGIGEINNNTEKENKYFLDNKVGLSEITVPIISNGEVIGIIDSEHPEKEYFTVEDLETMTTIASMTSSKLTQAFAQENLKKQQNNLETQVSEKTKELNSLVEKLTHSYEEISEQDAEKEILLKEIHHRVKNNLQIISSLLNIHINTTKNKNEIKVFRDSQSRIKSMALVHERLYAEGDLARISTKGYITELGHQLLFAYDSSENVKIEMDVEDVKLDIDTFIPLGLILNELLTNSLEHAFPSERKGTISISLKTVEGNISIDFIDDGIGIPKGFDIKSSESLGLELVETLSTQIDGKLLFLENEVGCGFNISFPMN